MSDPDFSADLEGISPAPAEEASSREEVDPLTKIEFENPDNYTPDEPSRIFIRGYADSYDEWFLVVVDAEPAPEKPELLKLYAFSAQDPERFTGLDFDGSEQFEERLLDLRESLDQTERKDSKNLENKLTGLLSQTNNLNNLLTPLSEQRNDDFRQEIRDFLIDEVFPGSQLNLDVRVVSIEKSEESSEPVPPEDEKDEEDDQIDEEEKKEDEEDEEEEDEDSLKLFKISPELDPIDGFALSDLRVGDAFDVRVIGESVRDLRDKYVDGDAEDAERSRIFNATLVRVQDVSLEGVKKYIVQLNEEIYGECTLDPETRVKVRQVGDVWFLARLKYRIFYALLFVFILMFSGSITFFLFPEPILNLIDAVTAAS